MGVEKRDTSYTVGGNTIGSPMENNSRGSSKTENRTTV